MSEFENKTPITPLNNNQMANPGAIIGQLSKNHSITPGLFILALVLFAMPFFKINCGSQTIASVTGYNLVFGTEIEEPGGITFGNRSTKTKEVKPVLWAGIAFMSILTGLFFSLNQTKEAFLYTAICGGVATALILILNIAVDNHIQKETQGGISVETTFAYWLVLLSMAAITVLSYVKWKELIPATLFNDSTNKIDS